MIKKLFKFCLVIFLVFAVLVVAAFFTLKKMYPPAKLKAMAQNYVSQKLNREFTFDSISFTWIGFTLTNAALSEDHTFQDGTFVKADKLIAHVAVEPLLQKRIEISTIQADGLQINIVAKKDGTFNFDTLLPAKTTEDTTQPEEAALSPEETPLVVTAKKINLTDCDIVYTDEKSGMRTALNDLNIEVANFDLNHPFETKINFITDISGTTQPDMILPVTLEGTISLAGLDFPNAYATFSKATAQYKTVQLELEGDIKNLETPSVNLTGTLSGINNTVLSEFAPGLPNFNLPIITLALKADANLDTQTATISQAKLSVRDSALTAKGTMAWNTPILTYNLSGSLTAIVDQLVQMTDTLDGFSPTGTVNATFRATEKKDYEDLSGTISLKDVSLLYEPFTLTQLNGNIILSSLQDISSPSLTGKLNQETFSGSFSYKVIPTATNIVLNLNLDKLVLTQFSTSANTSKGTENDHTSSTQANESASLPINIQANVKMGGISIPYFQSDGLTLTANLTNITDNMAHANGTIDFTLQPGKITNLDDFIKGNKIAKILLLPVGVVQKVAKLLKIDLFPSVDKSQGTSISFTEGAGTYTFTNGIMNIDKTLFNSAVTNISASGTANFQTDALDMKAKATLLTQAAPIAFKITGTMSNPKGKLDVVNTVTSVVGGILNGTAVKSAASETASLTKGTTNTATNTVKDTVSTATDIVKGIGDLFKKKNTNKE